MTTADDPVDITAVRTKLYHQGAGHLNERHHYFKVMSQAAGLDTTGETVELGEPGFVASTMYEALVDSGTFQWTLAAVLRLLQQESPDLAQKAAEIVAAVQYAGIEAIEDANDDLPEAAAEADSADPLLQTLIDNINSNPITRRAFTRLGDAYAEGRL